MKTEDINKVTDSIGNDSSYFQKLRQAFQNILSKVPQLQTNTSIQQFQDLVWVLALTATLFHEDTEHPLQKNALSGIFDDFWIPQYKQQYCKKVDIQNLTGME